MIRVRGMLIEAPRVEAVLTKTPENPAHYARVTRVNRPLPHP